ncbi:hypothetical protein SERLADRAFT_443285 [Serpula lacrymans var. lacrymans S7.9]|uniref:Uncharacterized protein n=1 Tax=Serpula lacrymans var. lacrymans (strain S7.9) TaxID=578457 RepID=F8PC44_SERL9|nr:uncharacterized protein SERLADRAFT_443285 [Serpula lacrymans var. lacrymans S7.9]EGO19244.1 hypothetical protein SERLADRAFT_443285 [Serpula lacrymans var. lacrymans S7.9]
MERGMIYQQISIDLILHSDVEEINRIRGRLDVLSNSLEVDRARKSSWNPAQIIKSYLLHRQHVEQSLQILQLARGTSNTILRKLLTADLSVCETLSSSTASFITAVEYMTHEAEPADDCGNATEEFQGGPPQSSGSDGDDNQGQDQVEFQGGPPQSSGSDSDDNQGQVFDQIRSVFEGIQGVLTAPQASERAINVNLFFHNILHMGSGPSTNPMVASGSNHMGGNGVRTTSVSPPSAPNASQGQ